MQKFNDGSILFIFIKIVTIKDQALGHPVK